jgi:hypothetical protein
MPGAVYVLIDEIGYLYCDRYHYLPHEVMPEIALLERSGVRSIVAANEAIPKVEGLGHTEIGRLLQSGSGLWAIYELHASSAGISMMFQEKARQ